MDEGFVSEIIKVEADFIAETLIIAGITKTKFSYCFIIHCFMENIQKLLKIQGQMHQAAAPLETFQVLGSLAKGVLRMRIAHGIICGFNWIADYTIIMLVHKIT